MGLESQSAINPRHKSRPIKADQPSIAWIKFITLSSSFGPSLECPALELAQISWISPLSASLIFLDLALVIGPTGTCNRSLNGLWFSSQPLLWKLAWWASKSIIGDRDWPMGFVIVIVNELWGWWILGGRFEVMIRFCCLFIYLFLI